MSKMARKLEQQDYARIEIKVTGGNLRNGHIYLAKHLDHFPNDCIGSPNARDGEGVPISLTFAGTGEQTTTDIPSDKLIFRARRPWRRFYEHCDVQEDDLIAIERIGARAYKVMPCKRRVAAQARSPLNTPSPSDSIGASQLRPGRSVARRRGVAPNERAAYDTPLALDAHDAHDGALFRRFRSAMLDLDAATTREDVEVEELLIYRDRSIETY